MPCQWPATATMPAMAKPIRIVYSTRAMPTWVRAVIRIPITARTVITRPTAVAIAMLPQVLVALLPKTASTDGPSTSTPLTVAITYPAIISQPIRNPRLGSIARGGRTLDIGRGIRPATRAHLTAS